MVVIVIGMHRSGTSAMAGILHKNNVIMGESVNFNPPPAEENVKGYFENYLFRRINDRILERQGYQVKSWEVDVPTTLHATIVDKWRIRNILKKYNNKYKKWGWKDPRTCLTLGMWFQGLCDLESIDDCRILYIVRDPFAVATSMVKRRNISYENALKLWKVYNEYALKCIDNYKVSTFYLSYERLCNNPTEESRRIFTFLGQGFDENIVKQFIDKKLDRSTSDKYTCRTNAIINQEIESIKKRIYHRLT